jgi:hypothetical protein
MSTASLQKWRSKHGGMEPSMVNQMKPSEDEPHRAHDVDGRAGTREAQFMIAA